MSPVSLDNYMDQTIGDISVIEDTYGKWTASNESSWLYTIFVNDVYLQWRADAKTDDEDILGPVQARMLADDDQEPVVVYFVMFRCLHV